MKQSESRTSVKKKFILQQISFAVLDVAIFAITAFAALWIGCDLSFAALFSGEYIINVLKLLPLTCALSCAVYWIFGLYSNLWEFAGEREMLGIFAASLVSSLCQTAVQFITGMTVPYGFLLIRFLLLFVATGFIRFVYKAVHDLRVQLSKTKNEKRRTMLIGAGVAGALTLRELQHSDFSKNKVVCIIDDDESKIGGFLSGVPVVGRTSDIPAAVEKYRIEEIIFSIPTAVRQRRAEILAVCNTTGCSLRTLPGIYQLVNGEVSIQKIRDVQIEDLLSRDSVEVNSDEIVDYISGKSVLVTGGGGSIGSELCRQIAANGPRRLIIFDIYENNAYAVQQELIRKHPELELEVVIGSVRDAARVESVFEEYAPDIVYHAAAHKHVPLMENSPNEAIKNNVFGTWNVASSAHVHNCETFILISTDKAVNPTNIMGASKRLCEMIIRDFAQRSQTKFACVRFGNVLGSNGSVIPLLKKQIELGGPVTVTHKDVVRYFMTISEAVLLVLQAGAYAGNGEIFVLDMGDPVRIDDLVRNMIRLSGLEPDVDISIEYTGLRPGEKLYEELLLSGEGLEKTPNDLIFVGRLEDNPADFSEKLSGLRQACQANSPEIKEYVGKMVPEYNPKTI